MVTFPNAKINLGLDVVSKRPDGYHNLETVFYPIPLEDVLEINTVDDNDAPDYTFTMHNAVFEGDNNDNLVVKAYKILAASHKMPKVSMALYKNIPTGAGLGGELDGKGRELCGDGFGLGLFGGLLRLFGLFLQLHGVDIIVVGLHRERAGEKKVAGVAVRNFNYLVFLSLPLYIGA